MIVIDTSALVAIFRQEPERDAFSDAIVVAEKRVLPAHVYLEYVMVTSAELQARDRPPHVRTGAQSDRD